MKIVFMGTPDFAVPTLKALHNAGDEILLVVTPSDRPKGRGRKRLPPPVKKAAQELGLAVYQPETVNSKEAVEKLASLEPDFIVVVAFGQILKKKVLEIPKTASVNLHGSLLPLFRGAAPMQRAIMEGCGETGVTTMLMARKMDAGDMLLKEIVPITPETTLGDLHDELAAKGAPLMVRTLELLAKGEITPEAQDESMATFAPKLEPAERVIDWNQPAEVIDRQVRGLSPFPAAYTWFGAKRVAILRSRLVGAKGSRSVEAVGRLKVLSNSLEVETGSGKLTIFEVRPEGKKGISALSWANGARLGDGSRFTNEKG